MRHQHMVIKAAMQNVIRVMRMPVLAFLYLYTHYISLLFAPRCRFYPSCSRYAYEAVCAYGVLKGLWLAARRLSKCHPWHEGGIDHIPEHKNPCCNHHTHHTKEYLP